MVLATGSAVGAAYRLDSWRDLIRENFVALDIAADADDGFAGEVRSTMVGHLQISEVRSTTQACNRTGKLARRDDLAYLQVGLVTDGTAVLRQDGRECALGPGDFAVYETGRPFFWGLRGSWRLFVYTWPRSTVLVGGGESQALTAHTLSGSGGLSGIVGRMLRELVTCTPELSPAGGIRLADEVSELVTTVATECRNPHEPSRPQTSLLQRIHRYIGEHLDDPLLDPPTIASAHFISTRQLHRLFAGCGQTVSQVIRRQRLERCRRDLMSVDGAVLPITEIARRWGFADPAAFSRSFRTTYGSSPTTYRAGVAASGRTDRPPPHLVTATAPGPSPAR